MSGKFRITRKIEIDAGHRVPGHKNKCRNIHGHRYTIEVTLAGRLQTAGSADGMVEDFGDIKSVLMQHVDTYYDHALILAYYDKAVLACPFLREESAKMRDAVGAPDVTPDVRDAMRSVTRSVTFDSNVVLLASVPTAENLARHWYLRLRLQWNGALERVRVYETPNCWADYPAN